MSDFDGLETEDVTNLPMDDLASVCHEIRHPINIIMSCLEALHDSCLCEENSHFFLMAQQAGETLLVLVEDVLTISSLRKNTFQLQESAPFDIRKLAKESIEMIEVGTRKWRLDDVTLSYRLDPTIPQLVLGDAIRVRQILFNLMTNAVKFTRVGSVTLFISPRKNGVICFSVIDTGLGIAREDQDRVFKPFQKGAKGKEVAVSGVGLGLTICQNLVKRMGGRIHLESQEGKGSTFHVFLPLPSPLMSMMGQSQV